LGLRGQNRAKQQAFFQKIKLYRYFNNIRVRGIVLNGAPCRRM
jgi:hypothetical protein